MACQGTKADGSPCSAYPRHGTDYCMAHSDRETQASVGFGGSANGALGGRPRRPREIELVQEVADEFKDELRAVFSDGLTAERGVVVGDGPDARVEYVTDHGHRLKTAQEILDRLHGKPKANADPAPNVHINFDLIADASLRSDLADVRRRLAAHRAIEPGGAPAGD